MNSQLLRQLAVNLANDSSPVKGLDTTVEIIRAFATEGVPDFPEFRKALDAWGIAYEEGGPPIVLLFGAKKTLKVVLPQGWKFSNHGGGGHVMLLDDRGASRLHWHIHGWDPVSGSVCQRFLFSSR